MSTIKTWQERIAPSDHGNGVRNRDAAMLDEITELRAAISQKESQTVEPVGLNYEVLRQFSEDMSLNYSDLCNLVRSSVVIKSAVKTLPEAERETLRAWAIYFASTEFGEHSTEANKLKAIADMLAADARHCTCHPDDSPPTPCARKYALSECRSANAPETEIPVSQQVAVPQGWSDGLSQDYNGKLGAWFSSRPGAIRQVQEDFSLQTQAAIKDELASAQLDEVDALLTALSLDPDTYRTDGGWLNIPKIKAALKDPAMYPHIGAPEQSSDSNPDAEWLTTAHLICADAGIAPGHISERLRILRDRLSAQPAVEAELTDAEIREWWGWDNGLEDCDMCKVDDFVKVVRAVLAKQKARAG